MNDTVHESELRPSTAVGLVDRALAITRVLPLRETSLAMFPSLLLAWLAIALYVAERVEGIRSLRVLFAVAFVSAHALRAVSLARFAGRRVSEMLEAFGLEHTHGRASLILRSNAWMALDLWAWSWLLVLAIRIEPWLVPAVLPLFALRALTAPTWLCDADHGAEHSGFSVLRAALDKGDGQRLRAMLAELLLLVGAIGLGLNLGAFAALAISTSQDVLGLDLSFVRAFLSPENHFALLVIACLSLCVIDPLRAVIAAQLYVENRLTRDGLLARSLVERCREKSRSVLLLCLFVLVSSSLRTQPSHAQEPSENVSSEKPSDQEVECDASCQRARGEDEAVSAKTDGILRDPLFAEFPHEPLFGKEESESTVSRWLQDLLRWLFEREDDVPVSQRDGDAHLELPGPVAFGLIAIAIAALGVASLLMQTRHKRPESPAAAEAIDPFEVPAEDHLRDADALAHRDVRAALRSLYLASLVRLGRRGLITLSHERTNGMYLRELKGHDERAVFEALTRIFENVVYGNVEPTLAEYGECRSLAERLREKGLSS